MILQGTLGDNFDIFAASGESTAWVLLWETRSRQIGVTVCPVAQFNFFSNAFDLRAWLVDCGCVLEGRFWTPQLITPENEGGDETNYPSPPTFTFFDHPDFPFGPCGAPAPLEPRGPQGPPGHHQDGLQLHHLLVIEKTWDLKIHRVSGYLCDLQHRSPNLCRLF